MDLLNKEGIPYGVLSDRQKRLIELRARVNEDSEFSRQPLVWIGRDRRGQALYKERWAISMGYLAKDSAWDVDSMPVADFGNVSLAGAGIIRTGFNVFPLINPAHAMGSPDAEPFEISTLAAVSGDRQIGSSSQPVVVCLGAYLVHASPLGGVYSPAASVSIRVLNAVGAQGGGFVTEATIAGGGAVNYIDQIPIVATTGRAIAAASGLSILTNVFGIFNGDLVFAELNAPGPLPVVGNVLYAMLELC